MTRAIGVFKFDGPAEALQVLDLPETHAAAGEVRIRVHAATVNPTDTSLRNGTWAARYCAATRARHGHRRRH